MMPGAAAEGAACDRSGLFCWLRLGLVVVAVAFTAALSYASLLTPVWDQLMQQLPTWSMGLVLADLYLGILLVSLWVIWRERSAWRSALWIVAFVGMGNIATYAYVVWALRGVTSGRDLTRFFHGRRHDEFYPSPNGPPIR